MEKHGADVRVRRLTTKSQFVALLYSQLGGVTGLREIEAALMSHQLRLYHAGARPVHRSTLADANAIRPWQVFAELFTEWSGNLELGMLLPGITVNTGPTDFAPIKQMQMERFNGEKWERFGPVLTGGGGAS